MKLFKKILAVALCVITMLSVLSFSGFAADKEIVFEVKLVSETDSAAVFEFSYQGNATQGLNALDVTFKTKGSLGECKKIVRTFEFKALCDEFENDGAQYSQASSIKTNAFSMATTAGITKKCSFYSITVEKKSSRASISDITFYISSCTCNGDSDVTSLTKIVYVSNSSIVLNEVEYKLNCKQSTQIDYTSSIPAKNLVWTSSNEKVATVDKNGVITANRKGTATITVSDATGQNRAECTVTVEYTFIQKIVIYVLFGWIWYI